MNYEAISKYIELIAQVQERYDHDEVYDVIDIVTSIYGYNERVLDDVNYYLTGYRDYEQLKEFVKEFENIDD